MFLYIETIHANGCLLQSKGRTRTVSYTHLPKELTEGTYTVEVKASAGGGLTASLPVSFMVNEMNAGKGSFTSEYPQQELSLIHI